MRFDCPLSGEGTKESAGRASVISLRSQTARERERMVTTVTPDPDLWFRDLLCRQSVDRGPTQRRPVWFSAHAAH
eukprot:285053-Pyramimonas_sp.AAC.1